MTIGQHDDTWTTSRLVLLTTLELDKNGRFQARVSKPLKISTLYPSRNL